MILCSGCDFVQLNQSNKKNSISWIFRLLFVYNAIRIFLEDEKLLKKKYLIKIHKKTKKKFQISELFLAMRAFLDNFDQSVCGRDFWNFSRRSVFLVVDPDVLNKLLVDTFCIFFFVVWRCQ